VEIIRALLAGEEVSHDGLVTVDRARLWTRPDDPPLLIGAAVSVATARNAATWADGLITVLQPAAHLREMIDTYRSAGGRGRLHLQVHVSWDPDEDAALAIAHDQWRHAVFPASIAWDLEMAEQFDAISTHVPPGAVRDCVLVSSDLGRHAAWLQELADLGFDELYVHHVGQEQRAFLDAFGEHVLPKLDVTKPVINT
jgi:alkanesulfonate monooxygenase SsuD/methylene tetrahydromethanopterin reductase-like flavin-dependent oxidoreductase (luciferase family)